jgi:hypothetical protein
MKPQQSSGESTPFSCLPTFNGVMDAAIIPTGDSVGIDQPLVSNLFTRSEAFTGDGAAPRSCVTRKMTNLIARDPWQFGVRTVNRDVWRR